MKHLFTRLLALALALSLALALAGCGGSEMTGGNPGTASQPASSAPASSTPASQPPASSAPVSSTPAPAASGSYASLEELWADPAQRKAFEDGFASTFDDGGLGMEPSFEAVGNTLTVTFQFTDTSLDYTGVGAVIDAAQDGYTATMISAAGSLDALIGAEKGSCTAVMRYTDPNGIVLSERAFTATDEVPDVPQSSADGFATLEEFWNSPGIREQLETQMAAMGSDEIKVVSVEVKGNLFAVTFQITDRSLMVDGLADLLEQEMDAQGDVLRQQAATFDSILTSGSSTIRFTYLDPNGGLLAEREFTAG